VPNPDRSALNGNNKPATINFLFMVFLNLFVYIGFSSGHPFKRPLYTNTPATVILVASFLVATGLFFFTEHLHFLQLEPIGQH
jgi:hypothetical protein